MLYIRSALMEVGSLDLHQWVHNNRFADGIVDECIGDLAPIETCEGSYFLIADKSGGEVTRCEVQYQRKRCTEIVLDYLATMVYLRPLKPQLDKEGRNGLRAHV